MRGEERNFLKREKDAAPVLVWRCFTWLQVRGPDCAAFLSFVASPVNGRKTARQKMFFISSLSVSQVDIFSPWNPSQHSFWSLKGWNNLLLRSLPDLSLSHGLLICIIHFDTYTEYKCLLHMAT